ncbi:MAG TPA: hypothetical protein GXZ52_06425 [Clostridiales bacterium]|jgi:hypothetical protein|nr:hypothetical protein [Clostridiales bacterium]
MKVSFEGIGETVATFYNSGASGAEKGAPVKLSANGEVCKCAAGENFAGVAISVNGGFAAVQTAGYVRLPYSGDVAPQVGRQHLVTDGLGGVMVDAGTADKVSIGDTDYPTGTISYTGESYLVLDVDTSDRLVGFMM